MDLHEDEITIINPTKQVYTDFIIKFGYLDNYTTSSDSFMIEPKESVTLSRLKGKSGVYDLNHNFFWGGSAWYLRIKTLQANKNIDFVLGIKNKEGKQRNLSIEIVQDEEIANKIEDTYQREYNKLLMEECNNVEHFPKDVGRYGERINACFGCHKYNFSNENKNAFHSNMWIIPEWKNDKWNEYKIYIFFDGVSSSSRDRLIIYRSNDTLITDLFESNGYKHSFEEKVSFIDDWNNLQFSFDVTNKAYKLVLNGKFIVNYTFAQLEFEIPDTRYIGCNSYGDSNNRDYGNFILGNGFFLNRSLSDEEINILYNDGFSSYSNCIN
ncbi:hypothetical protein ACFLZ6_00145 [Nanoarchaeota archaeon]